MEPTQLTGTIDRLLFQSAENGFSVFVLVVSDKTEIIIRGHLAQLHPGQHVAVKGNWVTHPKFGKQFEATACTVEVPTSINGLKKYLSSGLIKGIGPTYAQKLIDFFGSKVLEVIDKDPEQLRLVPGIGQKRAQQIITGWQDQKDISNIMVFLQDKGISSSYAIKIFKKYGTMSIAVVQENPYRLAEEIWGIGFKVADAIARGLGIAADSIKRVKAGILHQISQEIGNGHVYVELSNLKEKTVLLLELSDEVKDSKLKNALHELYNEEKIKLITHEQQHYVTLTSYYFTEKAIAGRIAQLIERPNALDMDLNAVYQKMRIANTKAAIELNEDQQHGIITCLSHKITIITGGPGTGKTTLIKQLLAILDEHKLTYQLTAPTGRAAKRINEGTGRYASTLHRLLEFDFLTHRFTRNEQNALKLDFLIVDEASMIDIFIAHALLKAIPLNAHIVFLGDVDQLPSVGAGNFLNDLITSEKVPCIRLTKIFRQAQDSLIIVNAHKVNSGEFPNNDHQKSNPDFIFIKENNPELVIEHIKEVFQKKLPRYGISADETTVLVPMNRGIVGTQQLNQQMQQLLNLLSEKQLSSNGTNFKKGDRVMQIRNNYDKIVFNGDCGHIEDINETDRTVTVRFAERTIDYEYNELDELVLAYAISIHKSQGSEYGAVIIPLFMQHFMLLQRNLLYTAITRAKKLCILLGQTKAVAIAVNNNKGLERSTFLTEFLTSDLSCR